MPLGPNFVIDRTLINSVFKDIDDLIQSPERMRLLREGPVGDPYWHFTGAGELNQEEKEEVVQSYIKAGWGWAECGNSSDYNERGGIWSVKLFKNPQPHRRHVK